MGSVSESQEFSGREQVLYWEDGHGSLAADPGAYVKGRDAWGKSGVRVSQMRTFGATLYTGELFDKNAATIVPKDPELLSAIFLYCQSEDFRRAVRRIDKALKVTVQTFMKVPFDRAHWMQAAIQRYPEGLPEPASNDATQWLFEGNIRVAMQPLHTALARLLNYCWPQHLPSAVDTHADRDGIVCLASVSGERAAADRLRDLLAAAYGPEWTPPKLSELVATAKSPGATVEDWLRDDFFAQHCALFHQRPFIWHIWDGRKDGFSALVNYHKLDRHNLQTLIYTYLGDWITRQEADAKANQAGADLRLAAARSLQKKLELILEGEPPYDIFVRWKPMEQQPIGWDPDLNDGVRLNIRPFVRAGVLRKTPNIKWTKDRGRNPPDSPWGEERFNSYEEYSGGKPLTNAMKLAAREQVLLTSAD